MLLSMPGDLTLTRTPAGTFGLFEVVGVELAGFGDVVFPFEPMKSGLFCREGRSPLINALIGRTFASPREGADAVAAADPVAYVRHQVAGAQRSPQAIVAAWAKVRPRR